MVVVFWQNDEIHVEKYSIHIHFCHWLMHNFIALFYIAPLPNNTQFNFYTPLILTPNKQSIRNRWCYFHAYFILKILALNSFLFSFCLRWCCCKLFMFMQVASFYHCRMIHYHISCSSVKNYSLNRYIVSYIKLLRNRVWDENFCVCHLLRECY